MKTTQSRPDLSVIIVNYNVKEFLANCLQSVIKASKNLTTEIFVVDNNSDDGSIPFLKKYFPQVHYIENKENYGFGKANNQAIQKANGKYTLLLNPDTLIQEDTLQVLIDFMESHQKCGAAGCKILNPDGSFAPESRRSVPTLSAAVYKAMGLTALFPNNKHFGAYYQGWKDEDEQSQVPVLSGSFMFFRTECLKEMNGFDERFFMYGEDIDLCYRVTEADWEIHYVPETSIIHYKGESTKKNELAYNRVFNDAIYKFFDKHYTSRYSSLFKFLIFWAIQFRVVISFFVNNIREHRFVLTDLAILNLSLIVGMVIRASFDERGLMSMMQPQFLWLNLLWSVLYLLFMQTYGVLKQKNAYSIVGSLKSVFFSFLMLVAITFFVRDLAFSRIILAVSFMLGFAFVGYSRFSRVNRIKSTRLSRGKINPLRIVLVGSKKSISSIKNKINLKAGWEVEIAGSLSPETFNKTESEGLNRTIASDLTDKIQSDRVDLFLFLMDSVSYKTLLTSIRKLRGERTEIKVVPAGMDFILGKSEVEYFDSIAEEDPELNYFNPIQIVLKRLFDVGLSLGFLLVLLPFTWVWLLSPGKKKYEIPVFNGKKWRVIRLNSHHTFTEKVLNRFRLSWGILLGKLSLVGSQQMPGENSRSYKSGLTGYVQINRDRVSSEKEQAQFDLHYLQNYSIWLDFDILFKALIREESLTGAFIETSEKGAEN
ncbi:glycosyltransferase [Rhodohalobacter sp. SW132]|uniref:glycosyltransferase n=1 Tax=Rhodohalobacter sp. SW132 TaxID=2293433 RepID=UPI000E289A01|nr:glycosyltransferase [Rhodohalobacter sp. SW132]REL25069.1 glycosyltransferase [Rhodohalobacter sp. SW132]